MQPWKSRVQSLFLVDCGIQMHPGSSDAAGGRPPGVFESRALGFSLVGWTVFFFSFLRTTFYFN